MWFETTLRYRESYDKVLSINKQILKVQDEIIREKASVKSLEDVLVKERVNPRPVAEGKLQQAVIQMKATLEERVTKLSQEEAALLEWN